MATSISRSYTPPGVEYRIERNGDRVAVLFVADYEKLISEVRHLRAIACRCQGGDPSDCPIHGAMDKGNSTQ